jgi:hypothetical protein
LSRLWDTTESYVAFEEKLAGVQGFRLEGRAVGRDEPPMTDLSAQQIDQTKGRKVLLDSRIGKISGFRKDKPDTVVFRLLQAVTQDEYDLLSHINSETGKHGPHSGFERRQGFDDERERRRIALWFGRADDSARSEHNARIAGNAGGGLSVCGIGK